MAMKDSAASQRFGYIKIIPGAVEGMILARAETSKFFR
jgi:hypothetical protein